MHAPPPSSGFTQQHTHDVSEPLVWGVALSGIYPKPPPPPKGKAANKNLPNVIEHLVLCSSLERV